MPSTEIYLLRHGQASFGSRNYDNLSDIGQKQARLLARYLISRGVHFDQIAHGNLVRQRDTAQPYLLAASEKKHQPAQAEHPGFNEFQAEKVVKHYVPRLIQADPSMGQLLAEPEGLKKHFQKVFVTVIRSWQENQHPHDEIETWDDFHQRVNKALDDLLKDCPTGHQLGIFTSGGVITVLIQRALGGNHELMWRMNHRIANASITRLLWDGEQLHLSFFNNYHHLETENLLTFR